MVTKLFLLVAYDIAADRRRQKIAQVLEKYGSRVNFSVFECLVSVTDSKKMVQELTGLMKAGKDTILVYTLCKPCVNKRLSLGNGPVVKKVVNML
jgi:CRISPR-associated protein Cas2